MVRILQRYIFREMGKTFVLTVLGLTAVLSMGGGVFNIIKLDDITAGQLVKLMVLVVPLAGTLTLPIATVFSASATYGRMAADNEFVACRASGINIFTLLIPTVVLSLFCAGITFVSINFALPGMVRNLDRIVGRDIESIIRQRLRMPGAPLPGLSRYRMYADGHKLIPEEQGGGIALTGVAFLEMTDEKVSRIGTCGQVTIHVKQQEGATSISAQMNDLSYFDRSSGEGGQFIDEVSQEVPSNKVPSTLPVKIKFLNLPELFHYRSSPLTFSEIRKQISKLRVAVGRAMVYQVWLEDLQQGRAVTISDGRSIFTIQANHLLKNGAKQSPSTKSPSTKSPINAKVMKEGWISIDPVVLIEQRGDSIRRMVADRATLEVGHGDSLSQCSVAIDLYGNVRVGEFVKGDFVDGDSVKGDSANGNFGDQPRGLTSNQMPVIRIGTASTESVSLPPGRVPEIVVDKLKSLSDEQLLSSQLEVVNYPKIDANQRQVISRIGQTVRKITGVIHQRLAFTVSVLVLGILAASLGIIFSQSQILMSVGISMAPALAVLVTILMGKQLAENEGTALLGVVIIWGGLALVAALDAWVLLAKLRR